MTQPDLFSQPLAPYAKGSHTSWKAAASFTLADRQYKTRAYLQLLATREDVTDPEAAAALRLPRSSLCSIRAHLLASGLIVKSGQERVSEFGKACAGYRLTEAGRRVVEP